MVVRPVASVADGAPTDAPDTVGLNSKVTVAGVSPVTRAESVQVPPPLRLQPPPPPDVAPKESSVWPEAAPAAESSSKAQNPGEKDR